MIRILNTEIINKVKTRMCVSIVSCTPFNFFRFLLHGSLKKQLLMRLWCIAFVF